MQCFRLKMDDSYLRMRVKAEKLAYQMKNCLWSILNFCWNFRQSEFQQKNVYNIDYWGHLKKINKVRNPYLKVMTFLGGPPFSLTGTGVAWEPFFLVSIASFARWKQLTRWPTSGGLSTREDRNLCTSSFLQSISLW